MLRKEILDYIHEQYGLGVKREAINDALLARGYQERESEDTLKAVAHIGNGMEKYVLAFSPSTSSSVKNMMVREAAQEFESALSYGFPDSDDEVLSRTWLGNCYFILSREDEGLIERGIEQVERALMIDAQNKCGYFLSKENRKFLEKYQSACGKSESGLGGMGAGDRSDFPRVIKYLEDKLRLFDYLPGEHMIVFHVTLGVLYGQLGNKEQSCLHYRKAVEAEILNPEKEHELTFLSVAKSSVLKCGTDAPTKSAAPNDSKEPSFHGSKFILSALIVWALSGLASISGNLIGGIINFVLGSCAAYIYWKRKQR